MWPLTETKQKPAPARRNGGAQSRVRGYERARARAPLLSEPRRSGGAKRALLALIGVAALAAGGFALTRADNAARARAIGAHLADQIALTAGLKIERVTVTGRDRAGRDVILAALGAARGQSIVAFDCAAARMRLKDIPWVAQAHVRRVLPGDIQVDIVERKPFAIWQNAGRLMLVDETGFAIVPVSAADLERYPHVVGPGAAENAAALIGALKRFPDLESRVRAAVRVGNRRWDLQLANGIAIELPAEGVDAALAEVARLDREMGVLSSDLKAIDMRFKDRWILKVPSGSTDIKPGPSRAT